MAYSGQGVYFIMRQLLKLCNLFAIEHSCMNFSQIVQHLGYLFVAIGSAELSNKTVLCVSDQKVFLIKTIYYSDGSCVAVEKLALRVSCSCCTAKKHHLLKWLKKQ
jgi:hypothetical protein